MKYMQLSGLILLLSCYQDLSKLKNGSDVSATSNSSGSVIILNKSSTTISFGSTDQLYASVLPNNQAVTWSSLNASVATVSASGLVTATGSGQTQIIAVIAGSVVYAGCTVTVPSGGLTANPADGTTVATLNSIVINYSESMNAAALAVTNYTLSGTGIGTLSVSPFGISRAGNIYTLSFSGAPGNGPIILTINSANVKTQGGNNLTTNTVNYTSYSWYTFVGGDAATSMQQTGDGGHIVLGLAGANIASFGGQTPLNAYSASSDLLIVKLTAIGAVQWYTFLGGAGAEGAHSIWQTNDGGYIITGKTNANIASLGGQTPLNSYTTNDEILVVKLNAAGGVQWYTFLGGAGNDWGRAIQQTSDGGYVLAGYASANIPTLGGQLPLNPYVAGNDDLIVRLSASGTVQWYTFVGSAGEDNAYTIRQTNDGGFIFGGFSAGNIAALDGKTPVTAYATGYDGLVVKLNASGGVDWYTFIGGTGADQVQNLKQTGDGGYIVAGHASATISSLGGQTPLNNYVGSEDFLVVKLNNTGNVQWYSFFGGSGQDLAMSIDQTSDGGYVIAGQGGANIASLGGQAPLNSYTAGNDFLVIKLSTIGSVQWHTFLGGGGNDFPWSIQQVSDGGYTVAGFTSMNIASIGGQTPLYAYTSGNDFLLVRLKSNGRL